MALLAELRMAISSVFKVRWLFSCNHVKQWLQCSIFVKKTGALSIFCCSFLTIKKSHCHDEELTFQTLNRNCFSLQHTIIAKVLEWFGTNRLPESSKRSEYWNGLESCFLVESPGISWLQNIIFFIPFFTLILFPFVTLAICLVKNPKFSFATTVAVA